MNVSGNPVRTTLIGLVIGLWVAASTALIMMIKQGANEAFQNIIDFVTNFPTLLFIERLGLPGALQLEMLFIYCAVIGAIFGWLAGMARTLFLTLFAIALAVVIVSHWLPEVVLEQGLIAAFESLGHALISGSAR